MTTNPPRVGLATCSALPDLDPDSGLLRAALAERGVDAVPLVWDDPDVPWGAYDLVVVRSTWDYSPRRDEYLGWAQRVPRLANPADVIAWNTDKGYLRTLETAGVPVIPTIWLDPSRHLSKRAVHTRMPAFGDFVVKPQVSAGARDSGRYQPVSASSRALAIQHAVDLLDGGRAVMIQPYVTSVDTAGETCLVFVDGVLQHAVRKSAMLTGPTQEDEPPFLTEEMEPADATAAEVEVATRALAVAAAELGRTDPLLYARVDLVTREDGTPLVIELELTEPSLWLAHDRGAGTAGAFADAIVGRLG